MDMVSPGGNLVLLLSHVPLYLQDTMYGVMLSCTLEMGCKTRCRGGMEVRYEMTDRMYLLWDTTKGGVTDTGTYTCNL